MKKAGAGVLLLAALLMQQALANVYLLPYKGGASRFPGVGPDFQSALLYADRFAAGWRTDLSMSEGQVLAKCTGGETKWWAVVSDPRVSINQVGFACGKANSCEALKAAVESYKKRPSPDTDEIYATVVYDEGIDYVRAEESGARKFAHGYTIGGPGKEGVGLFCSQVTIEQCMRKHNCN